MKVLQILGGFGLILIGLVLAIPFIPGPGTPLIILGLVILARHFAWARRLVDWARRKLEGVTGKKSPVGSQGSTSQGE